MNLVMEAQDDSAQATLAEYDIARRMAETLHTHYPDHLWGVSADVEAGIATVTNLRLSGKWGFIIKLSTLVHDVNLKSVVRAGGELLERYKMRRGRFDAAAYNDLPTDFSGNHYADK